MPLSKYFPASDDFEVASFPPYWIARLNAKYGMEMEKKLKPIKMDIARWRVAMMLQSHGELSISQVAEHAIAKLPTITKIVYRMQDEGLVTVRVSETDGRVSLVMLTDKGMEIINEIRDSTQKLFTRMYKGISTAEVERLNATIRAMLDNLMKD